MGMTENATPTRRDILLTGGSLLAMSAIGTAASTTLSRNAMAQATGRKPNIVVIMGDDIGIWNIGAYHRGMMAGRTPNLDKLAAEGMLFTDYYAEASCTAGRANFITGELPIRTGMTTVGQAGRRSACRPRRRDHCHRAEGNGLRHGPVRQEPPRRPRTSSCRRCTASTSSLAISIISMRWRTLPSELSAGTCAGRSAQHGPFLGDDTDDPRDAALGQGRQAEDRGCR
jgi:hypothetical protein